MPRSRQFFFGFLVALGLICSSLASYQGYQIFKEFQLMRAQNAAIINYLAFPTGKTNDKGEVITRADVLAAIAQRALDEPTARNNPPTAPKGAGIP